MQFVVRAAGQAATLCSSLLPQVTVLGQAAYFPGALAGVLLCGRLGQRPRPLVAVALASLGLSMALMGGAAGPLTFLAGRFLQGFGLGVFRISMAFLVDRAAADAAAAVRAQHLLNRINALVGPLLLVAGGLWSWRLLLTLQALLFALALGGLGRLPAEALPAYRAPSRWTPATVRIALAASAYLFGLALFWGLVGRHAGAASGWAFLGEAGSYFLFAGPLAQRAAGSGARVLLPVLGVAAIAGFLASPVAAGLWLMPLVGLSHARIYPTLQGMIRRQADRIPAGQRALQLGSDLGQALGLAVGQAWSSHTEAMLGLLLALSLLPFLASLAGRET